MNKGRHKWGSVCQEFRVWGPHQAKAEQAGHDVARWAQGARQGCVDQGWGQCSVLSPCSLNGTRDNSWGSGD